MQEHLPRNETVYLRYAYLLLAPPTNQLISLTTGQNLTVTAENREGIIVQINQAHSEAKPVAQIKVNFNEATENIDLTNLVIQTDIEKRKSILYMPEWPEVVENSKVLFIPK